MTVHDEVYKIIAKNTNLHQEVVEAICRSQFEFLSLEMENASYDKGGKSVRLPYFGLFQVKPYRLEKLKESKKLREELIFSQLQNLNEETDNISKE